MPASPKGSAAQKAVVADAPATPENRLALLATEIDNRIAIVQASAAAGIDPQRLKVVALSHFTRNPALWECTPVSIARAMVEAAQYGLEPIFGHVYLVPFRNKGVKEAQLILGYRGLVELARRSGEIAKVEAHAVHEKDFFAYEYGTNEHLIHQPFPPQLNDMDPGKVIAAWAQAVYRDGTRQFDVMSIAEINVIRDRSKGAKDQQGNLQGPWLSDPVQMDRKTVLRRLCPQLPLTVQARELIDFEDAQEGEVRAAAPTVSRTRSQELAATIQSELIPAEGEEEPPAAATPEPAPVPPPTPAPAVPVVSPLRQPKPEPVATPEPPDELEAQAIADGALEPLAEEPESIPMFDESQVVDGEVTEVVDGEVTEVTAGLAGDADELCGVVDPGLGAGPCVLRPGHEPPQEHQQSNGARWSMPIPKAAPA